MKKVGRPVGSKKLEGIRKQRQMRAYDDEWEIIQRFAKMVKHGGKWYNKRKKDSVEHDFYK